MRRATSLVHPWVRIVLAVAGTTALAVGLALVVAPGATRALFGTETGVGASALSEVRAPGGALVTLGVVMLVGAGRADTHRTALLVAASTYLGYAAARLLGCAVDGPPTSDLLVALAIEGLLGSAALLTLLSSRSVATASDGSR